MSKLRLAGITRKYGSFTAVDNLDLEVGDGEFVTLLGPSGCGKTTTLRMVAGFIEPDRGEIWFDDRRVTAVPPHRRNTAMVFQSYALFPHMSVAENVAFGLKMRSLPPAEQAVRIEEALDMVSLRGLESRRPGQLSGGQQQRVALARAIVTRPDILLFDEPLSNTHKAAALLFVAYLVEADVQKQMNATIGSYLARTDIAGENALIPEEQRQQNGRAWIPGAYKGYFVQQFVSQVLQK